MKALVLDFDGVISDSAPESFLSALRTCTALHENALAAVAASELAGAGLEDVCAHPVYRAFLEIMPLGNRAEDFGVVLSLLERGVAVEDQTSYDRERDALGAGFLGAFHERFYEERRRFAAEDPATWRALLKPYPAFVALLRRRAGDAALAIATAKDGESVALLLREYGIADLFPSEGVLDKETGVNKRAHLGVLRERLELDWHDITFVDDKVNHLDAVAELGVRCALAAWGYNGPREHELARRRGHLVCQLEDVEAQLYG